MKDDVAFVRPDPGDDVTQVWWEEMLVQWLDVQSKAE